MSESTVHKLKTVAPWFGYVWDGTKTFEVRYDDRGFKPGDLLVLGEWSEEGGWLERFCARRVQFILTGEQWGLSKGFCVLGFNPDDTGWNYSVAHPEFNASVKNILAITDAQEEG